MSTTIDPTFSKTWWASRLTEQEKSLSDMLRRFFEQSVFENEEVVSAIKIDREILGGTPCFAGTRVPVGILISHIADGGTLESFLSHYPSVDRDKAATALNALADVFWPTRAK